MSYLERVFRESEEENRRVILSAMRRDPTARLLDLGCADADFTLRVARAIGTTNAVGVEFVEDWAARARANGIECVVADLGKQLPFEDASFDVVHSNQVIEHLPKTDVFLREIRRVLRPSGYAVVSTNNLSSWHNVVSLVMGWQPTPCHVSDLVIVGNPVNSYEGSEGDVEGQHHLRVFTGRALAGLARFHGLDLDLDRSAGYYPLPTAVARVMTRIDRRHGAFLVQRFVPGQPAEHGGMRLTATRAV